MDRGLTDNTFDVVVRIGYIKIVMEGGSRGKIIKFF